MMIEKYRKISNEKLLARKQKLFEIATFCRGQRATAQKEIKLIVAELIRRHTRDVKREAQNGKNA